MDEQPKSISVPTKNAVMTSWEPIVKVTNSAVPAPDIYKDYDKETQAVLLSEAQKHADFERKRTLDLDKVNNEKSQNEAKTQLIQFKLLLLFCFGCMILSIAAAYLESNGIAAGFIFLATVAFTGGSFIIKGNGFTIASKRDD